MTSPKPIKTATQQIKIVVAHFMLAWTRRTSGGGMPDVRDCFGALVRGAHRSGRGSGGGGGWLRLSRRRRGRRWSGVHGGRFLTGQFKLLADPDGSGLEIVHGH